jgi:NADH-quinone oxidoreductase subunit G
MVRSGTEWKSVSWDEAIKTAAQLLIAASESHPGSICALMSSGAATEDYYLAQKLVRGLGSSNIDHRLREQDFSDDQSRPAAPEFAMKIAEMETADAVLLVACNPRHEAPILGHRLRKAWRKGAVISAINPLDWEFVFGTKHKLIAAPQFLVQELACVAMALASASGKELPVELRNLPDRTAVSDRHAAIASSLLSAENGLVLLGQFGMSHHDAAALRQLSEWIATASGCALNLLPHGANPVGAWLAGAVPHRTPAGPVKQPGLDRNGMLQAKGTTWLLWDFEPEFDVDNPAAMMAALKSASSVIAVTSFASDDIRAVAHVIFPLAPIAESEGCLFNLDGDSIGFTPAGKRSGDARPGWKILRRLGDELGLEGFGQVSLNELQAEMHAVFKSVAGMAQAGLKHPWPGTLSTQAVPHANFYRVGEVPIYSADALCRRTGALQQTVLAQSEFVGLNPNDAQRLGLAEGQVARAAQGDFSVDLEVRVSAAVPSGAAWLRSAISATRVLGSATGPVSIEAAK